MRTEFHAELADVNAVLVEMANQVRTAMAHATTALLEADAAVAGEVVSADADVNLYHQRIEEKVYSLLAQQAPVASDLRLLMAALFVGADFERMGDLAKHVAKIALRRHPTRAVPDELIPVVRDMAEVADRLASKIGRVVADPDATSAAELESDDDAMDELQKGLFVVLLGAAWRHGVESAIDGAMLGRFYERFADHAVNAGRRMYFLVTGEQLHPATNITPL